MKKVCVVTGSRADYGLLRCVMAGLRDSQHCVLQVIATGMHLASEFGYTWRHIEEDGSILIGKLKCWSAPIPRLLSPNRLAWR